MTAVWVVGIWFGLAAVFLLGWICCHALIGPCQGCHRWQAQCDKFEDELDATQAELTKALATVKNLNHNIGVAWDAGVVAGQTFQAERQENGL